MTNLSADSQTQSPCQLYPAPSSSCQSGFPQKIKAFAADVCVGVMCVCRACVCVCVCVCVCASAGPVVVCVWVCCLPKLFIQLTVIRPSLQCAECQLSKLSQTRTQILNWEPQVVLSQHCKHFFEVDLPSGKCLKTRVSHCHFSRGEVCQPLVSKTTSSIVKESVGHSDITVKHDH